MPLKGTIFKNYYPKSYQREMKDVDILCNSKHRKDIKDLMVTFGFSVISFNELNDDIYHLSSYYNFEIHFELFGIQPDKRFHEYYKNISNRLIENEPYKYQFKKEDFYIYSILHTFKHYIGSGVGVRYLLDTYLFLKNTEQDISWDYILEELKKLGIESFEKNHRLLAQKVFSMHPLTKEDQILLEPYLLYGTHGTYEHLIKNYISKNEKKSLIYYFKKRLFPNKDDLPNNYSFFREHTLFLPILWIYRPFKALYKSPSLIIKEIRTLWKIKENLQ